MPRTTDRAKNNAASDEPTTASLDLTLILGGVRSGKSARALSLAHAAGGAGGVLFVATAQALDEEMHRRIDAHKRERPATWDTVESPLALAAALDDRLGAADADRFDVVVIDCLTLWVSNILLTLGDEEDAEAVLALRTSELIDACVRHRAVGGDGPAHRRKWIVVSNEVGLGVVPATALGRRYRDALGRANQIIAAAAQHVTLMVAGIAVTIA